MSAFDVIVPCYNYAVYLEGCVNSVLSQRDVNIRVLIVDDASPDETPQVAAKLCARDSRVSYLRNERNLGLIGTANKGVLDWASADYCVLLSADDALAAGALARFGSIMDSHPEVHIVYGMAQLVSSDKAWPIIPDELVPKYQIIDGRALILQTFKGGNPAPSPAVAVRTATQRRLGGYLSSLKHTSDMEMWMRFAAHGPVGVVKQVQAFYRLHDNNMSVSFLRQAVRDRQEVIDACEEVVTQYYGHDEQMRDRLRELKTRLADEAYWLAGKALEGGDTERMRACRAFADLHHPARWSSSFYQRFLAKSLLGANLSRALRRYVGAAEAGETKTPYNVQSGEVGWWPEAG